MEPLTASSHKMFSWSNKKRKIISEQESEHTISTKLKMSDLSRFCKEVVCYKIYIVGTKGIASKRLFLEVPTIYAIEAIPIGMHNILFTCIWEAILLCIHNMCLQDRQFF